MTCALSSTWGSFWANKNRIQNSLFVGLTCIFPPQWDHVPLPPSHKTPQPAELATCKHKSRHITPPWIMPTLLSGDTGQSWRRCPKAVKLEKSTSPSLWCFLSCFLMRPSSEWLGSLLGWGLEFLRWLWGDICSCFLCLLCFWFSCWMKSIQRSLLGASSA